jgi:hypothetical protein
MLRQPIPLTSTDEVGAEAEEVVNPRSFRGGSMVGIMLYIQTDEGLRYAENNSDENTAIAPAGRICKGLSRREPVLHEGEEGDVRKGTGEESGGAIFTPSAHNLKDFVLYLTFEWSVKFVPD